MNKRMSYMKAAPDAAKGFVAVHSYLAKSSIEKGLLDLVYLRVSQVNNCAYCIDMHAQDLKKHGVPFEKMLLVPAWREAGEVFTERERAALAWAESLALVADSGVPDSDYLFAISSFNERELADLSVAIALMSAFNRLGVAFRNEPAAAVRVAQQA